MTPLKLDHAAAFYKHNVLCSLLYIDICHQQRGLGGPLEFGRVSFIYKLYRILWHPCLYFPGHGHFTFNRNSEFSVGKE